MNRYTRWIKPLSRAVRQSSVVACAAALIILFLTVAYWICPLQTHRKLYEFSLLMGGIIGLLFAYWRCHTADENRKQEQYRIASELLDMNKSHYAERVAGAATLSDLVNSDPKQYGIRVMKTFEAFLEFPPSFGGEIPGQEGAHLEGQVDYKSRDTEEIVNTINTRTPKQRKRYRIVLRHFAPFAVTEKGDVEPNPKHKDYENWVKAEGQRPIYSRVSQH